MSLGSEHHSPAACVVGELMARAIAEERRFADRDDRPLSSWDPCLELQRRGTPDVYRAATAALGSTEPAERVAGATVLGQLGYPDGGTLVEQSVAILVAAAAREGDPTVLRSIAIALGHRQSRCGRRTLLDLATHPSPAVRLAVAQGLWGKTVQHDDDAIDTDPAAVTVLMDLMGDDDAEVRNWATFALGTQVSADGPEIRAALRERLQDDDEQTREEAVCGLANRRDEIAFEPLMGYLRSGLTGTGAIRAAEEWGDPRFHEILGQLRNAPPDEPATT